MTPLVLVIALIWPVSSSATEQVDDYVRSFIERHRIPSAAISVVPRGQVVKAAGYGLANLELQVPATESSVYQIGSITKQFTAEAILALVEERKLELDDPVHRHLKGLPKAGSAITVRHLLTHTSGLKDWESGNEFSYRREYTSAEFIDLVARSPLDFSSRKPFRLDQQRVPIARDDRRRPDGPGLRGVTSEGRVARFVPEEQ